MWELNNKYLSFLIILLCFSCNDKEEPTLKIACAANAKFAIEEICDDFEKAHHIPIDLITSSSGKITSQISSGAPYDVFISADLSYPEQLYQLNLTMGSPRVYARGHLAMWTMLSEKDLNSSFKNPASVNKIAIANPKTAPYGRAALEYLNTLNNFKDIESKLVFGESISQTNQFILSKGVDFGITSNSIRHHPVFGKQGNWQSIEHSQYSPINQAAVILKKTTLPKEAKLFYTYLFSESAKKILVKFGYSVNE